MKLRYSKKEFKQLITTLLPNVELYIAGYEPLSKKYIINKIYNLNHNKKGLLILGNNIRTIGYYICYFDCYRWIIHIHSTNGTRVNRKALNSLKSISNRIHSFKIIQHVSIAPKNYAAVFIIFVATIYYEGKTRCDKKYNIKQICEYFNNILLTIKKKYNL